MEKKVKTSEKVDQFIGELAPDIQKLTIALRKIIFDASSQLTEEYKWSMPTYAYHGLVCYLQPAKRHINLGFYKGSELQVKDEAKLLQGTGKTMRHIKITKHEEIQEETFMTLIKEAMKLNEA